MPVMSAFFMKSPPRGRLLVRLHTHSRWFCRDPDRIQEKLPTLLEQNRNILKRDLIREERKTSLDEFLQFFLGDGLFLFSTSDNSPCRDGAGDQVGRRPCGGYGLHPLQST